MKAVQYVIKSPPYHHHLIFRAIPADLLLINLEKIMKEHTHEQNNSFYFRILRGDLPAYIWDHLWIAGDIWANDEEVSISHNAFYEFLQCPEHRHIDEKTMLRYEEVTDRIGAYLSTVEGEPK